MQVPDGTEVPGLMSWRPRRPQQTARLWVNYAAIVPITSCETMGWLRTAVGIALIAAPGVPMRLAGQKDPTGAEILLMRTIGIRDLVLGSGTVAAARSDDVRDVRRWTATGLASDSIDAAASLASFRSIGKRDAWGAAILALAFVCGDLEALRRAKPLARDGGTS